MFRLEDPSHDEVRSLTGKQKTIAKPFRLSGTGLHSGKETSLDLSPAPPNSGIYFIKEGRKIPAQVKHVKETRRGTSIDGIAVIEHFLSAVYILGIDNLKIEIKGDEMPSMDGSALPYVRALEQTGIAEQDKFKNTLAVEQPLKIVEESASLEVLPYHGLKIDFVIDFPGIGEQCYSFELKEDTFKNEIAPARTFGYIEEYEMLKEQGLARGASFENALVLGKDGYINTPRFPDEPVRHKILDLIGDLALLGRPIQTKVRAYKSGHKLNIELVRLLSSRFGG